MHEGNPTVGTAAIGQGTDLAVPSDYAASMHQPMGKAPPPTDRADPQTEADGGQHAGTSLASGSKEVALVFASRSLVYVAGVLTQSLLAYSLLPQGRGAYAVCVTFASLLGVVMPLSVDTGSNFFVITKRLSVSRGVVSALVVCIVGSVVAIALAVPFIGSDMAFFKNADTRSFTLALVLVPFFACSYAMELQLAGFRRFKTLAILLCMQSIATLAGVLLFVRGLDMGVDGAMLALIGGRILSFGVSVRELRRRLGLRWELPSFADLKQVLGYGIRYHVSRVGTEVEWRVGIVVLAMFAGRADIGLFAAVSVVVMRLGTISNSVGTVLYPRLAGSGAQHTEMVGRCLRLVNLATGLALLAALALGEPLVRILLSEAFVPAVPLIWILAPGVLAQAAAGMFFTYFQSANRPGICSWAVWFGLTTNIVSLGALYPALGIESAAWGFTIGSTVRTVFAAIFFHALTGARLRSIWLPQRGDLAYLWRSYLPPRSTRAR